MGSLGQVRGSARNGPLINGALIAMGLIGVVDDVAANWLLGLHRLVPGPEADLLEPVVVLVIPGLAALGAGREWAARRQ